MYIVLVAIAKPYSLPANLAVSVQSGVEPLLSQPVRELFISTRVLASSQLFSLPCVGELDPF